MFLNNWYYFSKYKTKKKVIILFDPILIKNQFTVGKIFITCIEGILNKTLSKHFYCYISFVYMYYL